jgi:hypothetical protein
MSLDIIAEIWDNVKPSINPVDRRDAAEAVVATLIENNYLTLITNVHNGAIHLHKF